MTGLLIDATKMYTGCLIVSTCSTVVIAILLYSEQTEATESPTSGRRHHSL